MKSPEPPKNSNNKKQFENISIRKIIFLSIIAVLPKLFNKYFESILDEYIGKPIFQNLESSYFADFIFSVVAILLIIYYCYKHKKDHYFSYFDSLIVIIVGVWYCIYRFNNGWHYNRFCLFPYVFYTDVLLIALFFHITFIEKKYFAQKQAENQKDSEKGFQTDKPIKELSDEKLGRGNYAQKIAEQINDSFPKESFAIGVTGKWGSGKTSFLHLIKKKLNPNTIIVDFNAWHSHETKNLITDFFALLKAELNDGSVSQHINLYVKQLTAVDDNIYFKTIDFLQKTIFGNQSTQEIFDRINASIKRLNKQIVIFIDDLDRLDNNEIIEIIKLIRISANFKNTVFVVAFDKGYVTNAIEEINPHEKERFLEKIFQAEFPLPTFEKNRIKNELIKRLKINIDKEYHHEIDTYLTSYKSEEIVEICIKSLRDVTRFVNIFSLDFDTVKGQVLFRDFFNVELLKLKHLLVYESLSNSNLPEYLLTQEPIDESGPIKRDLDFYKFDVTKFDEYVETEEAKANGYIINIDDIKNIIEIIFTSPEHYKFRANPNLKEQIKHDNLLSIRRPSNFRIYFSMRLTEGKLSEIEFTKARQTKDINKFKSSIINWVNNGLVEEVFLRFKVYDGYESLNDFELIMKGMFELGQNLFNLKFQEVKKKEFYKILVFKIRDEYENVEYKYENQLIINEYKNYREFITIILESSDYNIGFRNEFMQFVLDQYTFFAIMGYPLSENKVKELSIKLFWECCQKNITVNDELWNLYILYLNTQNVDVDFRNNINETMQAFAIHNDIKGFCRFLIQESEEEKRLGNYKWHQDFELMFPEKNSFLDFCASISTEEQKLKDKLIEFYHKFNPKESYSIEFDFKNVLEIPQIK